MGLGDVPRPLDEKKRVCPHCREQISVLAVKCKHCGEEVGKPKEETRVLSLDDLGGETVYHEAPSDTVMEAMEMFRTELTGQSGSASDADTGSDAMPKLDDANQEFLSSTFPQTNRSDKSRKSGGSWRDRVGTAGKAIAVALVILFVSIKGTQWVRASIENSTDTDTSAYLNRASKWMEEGRGAIEVLEEAHKARATVNNAENRRIYEDAIDYVTANVNQLLTAKPFDLENITDATGIARKAAMIDKEAFRDLLDEARDDSDAYEMILVRIEPGENGGNLAAFSSESGAKVQEVKPGDLIGDRFYVRSVTPSMVSLEDRLRGNRDVKYRLGFQPRG